MPGTQKLKVLVVDDTIVYRKAVSDILSAIPGVEVVGVAHNGSIALSKIKLLKPDLLTLDIEMPEMNGIEVLEHLHRTSAEIGVIMLSTLTVEGGALTLRALELGAFDFILKPQADNVRQGMDEIKAKLEPIIAAFRRDGGRRSHSFRPTSPGQTTLSMPSQRAEKGADISAKAGAPAGLKASPAAATAAGVISRRPRTKSAIVAIGISTGGPNALSQMLPMLPADLGVPVVIVQHMPPVFTRSLAESLDKKCGLTVKEAEEGEDLVANTVYIAPGGRQMKLIAARDGSNRKIRITDDPPENSCRPSADYLFRSVADYFVGRTTAVIMTGMGSDGTAGLAVLREKSAYIIGQDEDSCVVYGMPKAPAEKGYLDIVLPLDRIAAEITRSVREAL